MRSAVVCYPGTTAKASVKYLCPTIHVGVALPSSSYVLYFCLHRLPPPLPSPPLSISSLHRSIHHTLAACSWRLPFPPPPPLPAGKGGTDGRLREVRIMPLIWVYARTLVPYPSPARRGAADLPECCVNTGGRATRAPHHKRRLPASALTRWFTATEGEELLSVCNCRRWQ